MFAVMIFIGVIPATAIVWNYTFINVGYKEAPEYASKQGLRCGEWDA